MRAYSLPSASVYDFCSGVGDGDGDDEEEEGEEGCCSWWVVQIFT